MSSRAGSMSPASRDRSAFFLKVPFWLQCDFGADSPIRLLWWWPGRVRGWRRTMGPEALYILATRLVKDPSVEKGTF